MSILLFSFSCKNHDDNKTETTINNDIKVEVTKVGQNSIGESLNYNGVIEPKTSTPLSFLLPGTVTNVFVEVGDKVKKGEVLASIDNTSQLNTYNGTLAALNQAKDAYNRLKSVYDKGSLPEIQLQEITSKLEQAKATNQVAYRNLQNCTLKSPTSGFIGSRNIEIGSSTIPGSSVFDLVTLDEVYVKIAVPENEVNQIKIDQNAFIKVPAIGNQSFEGKIEKVGVIANMLTKTYEVKIVLNNSDLIIKSGMACDVTVKTNPTEGKINIPYRSILRDKDGNTYVFIVQPDQTVLKKTVQLGSFINNDVVITSGLQKDDVVVCEGQHSLDENDKVYF